MDPHLAQKGTAITDALNVPNESDIFATLHHLVSRIDTDSRTQEVVEKAQSLETNDTQLLVDCLSMALDKSATPSKTRSNVWRSLVEVASSAQVFAQHHTINPLHVQPEDGSSPDFYRISNKPSVRIKVLKKTQDGTPALVHITHPNIIPLYAIFLDGEERPSVVAPCVTDESICDYARKHPELRMLLVSDVVNGLFHIHQLDIVHGALYPDCVFISDEGRALIANPLVRKYTQDFDPTPVRYSAPELLGEDDSVQPTKATDMWSFACLCYEVLSGKVPFFQINKEFRVSVTVSGGSKPTRPGKGAGGNEIENVIWQLLLMCWEHEPADRPLCLKVHQILLGMGIQDGRPRAGPTIGPEVTKGSPFNLEHARDHLRSVLGSDHASSLRVPEHLRKSLLRLLPDGAKFEAAAIAAKKLSPGDTQCFVDFLDLILEDLPDRTKPGRLAIETLLSKTMMSTDIIPRRYLLNGVQYDPHTLVEEGSFWKVYKGRGLNVHVIVVTDFGDARKILRGLPNWSHSSHPNLVPFDGVFHEGSNESPRLCVVTSLWKNSNLRNYATTLPQEKRKFLIHDTIKGIRYLHELGSVYGAKPLTPEKVLISDEGRAVLAYFALDIIISHSEDASAYELRFAAPNVGNYFVDDIWAFGQLCYEVLSRKPPYHQYTETKEIQSAVSQGELPARPNSTGDDVEEIDDQAWELITKCCSHDWQLRPTASEVLKLITHMISEDNRPEAEISPGIDMLAFRSRPDVDFPRIDTLLGKIQVELLRSPLSKLVQNRIKDVVTAAMDLKPDDIRTLVDFLDLALKDHLSISEERNRVLALLSKITSSTLAFPQRYEVKGIKYRPAPIAEGGFGTVHEGLEFNMCVKVMTRVDPKASTEWIRELILWAHSSHPNVLPFYGVFLENAGDSQRICLVSPFMKNGNLHDYAPRLPQKSRLPLILDTVNGLQYIHGLGIIHSDLKGQNVLISDEGRAFITDFGASHVVTATAAATGSSVFSTLRFAAPELMQDGAQLSKECDIWSFGCLCYQVLSRKVPYYQYGRDFQVAAALSRKELPRRPGQTERKGVDETDEDGGSSDDDFDEDWDSIDNQAWDLITKCCMPEPEDRLKVPAIQELIADMKVWDSRPVMKAMPGAEIFQLRINPEVDLNRAGEILDQLQGMVAPSETGPERDFVSVFNNLI